MDAPLGSKPWMHDPTCQNRVSGNPGEASSVYMCVALAGIDVGTFYLLTELSGVDLLMADLKALEAYSGYFYYLSKIWSKPLPEVYDPKDVDDYFNSRPHLVAIRLIEVVEMMCYELIINMNILQ